MQLDRADRGFSFLQEGPLDMRMDPDKELTAKEIVNKWPEQKLGELLRDYGEEPRWRKAAQVIKEARKKKPIETTKELAEILACSLSRIRGKLHPATLVFQALRIAVNEELESLKIGIEKALFRLASGGRMGVISFHRLEDRIVKNRFREAAAHGSFQILTKKPLVPTLQEARVNPRARSAKLRFIEKKDIE